MATADVLLVNLWCHDIGREHGAGKPLLRTVLQVHLRMFTPRRTLLVFCVRDKTRTPEALLSTTLGADLDRLWADLAKPAAVGDAALSDFFDVRYVFLANYEERPEVFLQDVATLRHRLTSTHAPDSLASPPGRGVPGSALALSLRRIWQDIKENKDLDLPAHRVMVATVRCEQVAASALQALRSREDVARLAGGAAAAVTGLGLVLGSALAECLEEYDSQTQLFDTSVRTAKRMLLLTDAMEVLRPLHDAALGAARTKAVAAVKAALGRATKNASQPFNALAATVLRTATAGFDMDAAEATPADTEGASWSNSVAGARTRLVRDATRLVETARCAAAQSVCQELSVSCCRALGPTAAAALEAMAAPDVWPRLRRLLVDEQRRAIEALDAALAPLLPTSEADAGVDDNDAASNGGEAMPAVDVAALRLTLASALASCIQDKVRDAAAQVGPRLRARFGDAFAKDPSTGLPRAWSPRDDVDAAAAAALREALDLLGVLAIMRLDAAADTPAQAAARALRTLLPPGAAQDAPLAPATPDGTAGSDGVGMHPSLTGTAWDGVVPHWELLSPTACVAAWRALSTDTAYLVLQARTTQEAAKRAAGGAPPLWAIVAMIILGFDEIMWLLRSPVTLLLLGTLLLFGRAVYAQMDVDSTINALGLVPSLAVLAARLVPSVLAVLHKLIEAGAQAGAAATATQTGQQAHGGQPSKKEN